MKRIKTQHEYHDADIIGFRWNESSELLLDVLLDGSWNSGYEGPVLMRFLDVRNREMIDSELTKLSARPNNPFLANIVGIRKLPNHHYLIDATPCSIQIDAGAMMEN